MRATAAVLLGATVLAGCGGGDDADQAAAPPTSSPRCEAASSDLTTPLANGIDPDCVRLTRAFLVQSSAHDGIYFVSAEIDGPGHEDAGDVATWASTSRFGGDLLYAVDDLANELSTLRDGREVAGLSSTTTASRSRAPAPRASLRTCPSARQLVAHTAADDEEAIELRPDVGELVG